MKQAASVFKKGCLIIVLIMAQAVFVAAQTGIFYYPNPSENYVNNKLQALTEAPNQEIYLMGKLSNANYESSIPYLCRIDKRGNLLTHKALSKTKIYDLSELFILDN